MAWLVTKYLITAAVVVLVSELAKRSDKVGALVAALPLVTILTLIWLYVEQQPTARIANHARYTFWYVVPTLPMFLLFPLLLERLGFWPALLSSSLLTMALYVVWALVMRRLGIDLIP
jgi:Mg/Co/Ni transporter MgtE